MDGLEAAWAVLGLNPGAERATVRRAFRAAARATHPDHGGDAAAFQRVRAAFDQVLPLAPAGASAAPHVDPYRGFLAGLDAAARLPVVAWPPVPAPGAASAAAPGPAPASAARFAAVLADVLAAAA